MTKSYTTSVDAGNGGVNAVIAGRGKQGYKSYYMPSVRAAATGDSLGLGPEWELDYQWVEWNGHRYITGDDVTRITKRGLERHTGSNRYGNELQQFLVAKALAELGVKEGQVNLTVFAPPGLFVQARQDMLERFMQDPPVTIFLKGDKAARHWTYSNISVWPEGIGAAACFVLDKNGKHVSSDILSGETVILDAGAHTLDALKFSDGNFNPEQLEHATWEAGGVDVHIRQPILRTVHKADSDFTNITVDDIDRAIRLGTVSGDYTLKAGGREINLESLLNKYRTRYAEWVANNIADGVFGGFKGIKSVILVGGGAYFIADHMAEWYGDKLLDAKSHATTKGIPYEDMNAVGGLRLALLQAEQA